MSIKKKQPVKEYVLDVTFYAVVIKVKARTASEARKKAMIKLKKKSPTSFINRNCTFLDKR